jgi:hypothetical protein
MIFRTRHDLLKAYLLTAQLQMGLFVADEATGICATEVAAEATSAISKATQASDEESSLKSILLLLKLCGI